MVVSKSYSFRTDGKGWKSTFTSQQAAFNAVWQEYMDATGPWAGRPRIIMVGRCTCREPWKGCPQCKPKPKPSTSSPKSGCSKKKKQKGKGRRSRVAALSAQPPQPGFHRASIELLSLTPASFLSLSSWGVNKLLNLPRVTKILLRSRERPSPISCRSRQRRCFAAFRAVSPG